MAKQRKKGYAATVGIPEGVEVNLDKGALKIKGKNGEVERKIFSKKLSLEVQDKAIFITAKKKTQKEKKLIGSLKSHIKNSFKGVTEGHRYILKICASHFPMNVSVSNNELIVKNFIGEKVPRKLAIKEGVKVKIEGDLIIVESINKELAGQTAANIEILTKRANFDLRIFEDGIYIINKDGKELQ